MNENIETASAVRQIVIAGGGITGLSAAYALQQAAHSLPFSLSIHLIEADNRLGGKILTEQAGDFVIEGGPDCFLRQKPWANELARALGLAEDLLDTNDHQRKTFVLKNGRLLPLPDGVMLIIPTRILPFALSPLFSITGKIRMGMDWFIPKFEGNGDESIGDFIRRRLGQEALERLAEPLLSGIHVSDPEKQSLLATFPRFRHLEQKYGSLIRGMLAERKLAAKHRSANSKPPSVFQSFKQGLGHLPNALEKALSNCTIHKNTKVTAIEKTSEGRYWIYLNGTQRIIADAVILAIPSYNAANLLREISPTTSEQLDAIPYVSTATISLAFRKQDIQKPFTGFGFVVPRTENRKISACTWSSLKFDYRAPADHLLLRCFVGGPGKEEMVDLDDETLLQIVQQELESILGLKAKPVLTRIYRWHKANPQYEVGHVELVQRIFASCQKETPGIFLSGSAYEGVGIPDCINQGKKVASELLRYLQQEQVVVQES